MKITVITGHQKTSDFSLRLSLFIQDLIVLFREKHGLL